MMCYYLNGQFQVQRVDDICIIGETGHITEQFSITVHIYMSRLRLIQ